MAWFKRRKERKDPGLRVASTFTPGAIRSSYSAQRSGQFAQTYADVHFLYEIVSRISMAASTLPLKAYELVGSDRAEAPDHPGYLLIRRPNKETPRTLLITTTIGDLCLWGNAFWLKVRPKGGGAPIELWRLRPDRMTPVPSAKDGTLVGWFHTIDGKSEPLLPENVVHFRNYNPLDDHLGLAPITALRYEVELGRDAEQAAIDFWKNGALLSGVLASKGILSEDALEALQKQFMAMVAGPGNHFNVPILEEGTEFKPISVAPKDSEFINTANLTRERVARAYGYFAYDEFSARATPDELRKSLFADAVIPWTTLIEETLEVFLFSEWEDRPAFPQFVTRHILEHDIGARFAAYKDGVYAGWLPPKQIQKWEDIDSSLPTYIPMNMNKVNEDGSIDQPAPQGPKDSTGGLGGDPTTDGPSTGSGDAKGLPDCPKCGLFKVAAGSCPECGYVDTKEAPRLVRPPWWEELAPKEA